MQGSYWLLVRIENGYYIWQSPDKFYQLTRTNTPPSSTAGYKNLESIGRLKVLKS
jgi:hypothetical protein